MTPAEPDQGVPGTARTRRKVAALGVAGALLVPLPAAAAPAPCEQALRYAAQSGTQLMRIGTLDLGPTGRDDKPIKNVGVGDVKSALVAQSAVNAAALGRVLDGDAAALTEVLQQTAPPTNRKPERRAHAATEAGPFSLGAGELTVHAQWDPRMACGNVASEATRAETELRWAGVLAGGGAALVRVPGRVSGLSTTAMERRGPAARAVAAASMAGGKKVELLGGAVVIKVVKPPSLLATMSGRDGGEVRYKPAVVEVSGEGFETARLDTAGDGVELRLDGGGGPAPARGGAGRNGPAQDGAAQDGATGNSSAGDDAAGKSAARVGSERDNPAGERAARDGAAGDSTPQGDTGQDGARKLEAGSNSANQTEGHGGNDRSPGQDAKSELFSGLPKASALNSAAPLPLPPLPAVPPLSARRPNTEAAPATPGTTVNISLGDVRKAVSGHAIAAKATAMTIAITQGPDRQAYGDSAPTRSGVVLDLDMGLLEVAAVAPEPAGGVSDVGGTGGGLPITGPRVDALALAGVVLLIAGAAALVFGMRGRSRP